MGRNELKTLEIGLGGRNRLNFGTVRPGVQIPGTDFCTNLMSIAKVRDPRARYP